MYETAQNNGALRVHNSAALGLYDGEYEMSVTFDAIFPESDGMDGVNETAASIMLTAKEHNQQDAFAAMRVNEDYVGDGNVRPGISIFFFPKGGGRTEMTLDEVLAISKTLETENVKGFNAFQSDKALETNDGYEGFRFVWMPEYAGVSAEDAAQNLLDVVEDFVTIAQTANELKIGSVKTERYIAVLGQEGTYDAVAEELTDPEYDPRNAGPLGERGPWRQSVRRSLEERAARKKRNGDTGTGPDNGNAQPSNPVKPDPRFSIESAERKLTRAEYNRATQIITNPSPEHRAMASGIFWKGKNPLPIVLMRGTNRYKGATFGLNHLMGNVDRHGDEVTMFRNLFKAIDATSNRDRSVTTQTYNPPGGTSRSHEHRVVWTDPDSRTKQSYVLGLEEFEIGGKRNASITTFFPVNRKPETLAQRKAEERQARSATPEDINQFRSAKAAPSYSIASTPAFKAWFRDGAVTNEDGSPRTVHHATFNDFNTFKIEPGEIGIHLGTLETATNRIDLKRNEEDSFGLGRENLGEPRILEVYTNIQNPLRLPESRTGGWRAVDIKIYLRNGLDGSFDTPASPFPLTEEEEGMLYDENFKFKRIGAKRATTINLGDMNDADIPQFFRDWLQSKGYDGIVYENTFEKGGDSYIAFGASQVKSANENSGAFDATNPDIRYSIGHPALSEVSINGTGPNGRITNWDVGQALTDQHMEVYGRTLDADNPQDRAIILERLQREYDIQLAQHDDGQGWYIEDIERAIAKTKAIIPQLDPRKTNGNAAVNRDLFLTIAALMSPQEKPGPNWEKAIEVFQGFMETGVMPSRKENGKGFGVNAKSLPLIQHMIDTLGSVEQTLEWITTPKTGLEIATMRKNSGVFSPGLEKTGKISEDVRDYKASEVSFKDTVLGIYAFGPKVGDFMMNSTGFDQTAITVDLWLARTYNRHTGRLLEVGTKLAAKKKIISAPRGKTERGLIKSLIAELAFKNGVDPSAMQAALWYFEQRLFRNYGINTKSTNFSGAADIAVAKRSQLNQGATSEVSGVGEAQTGQLSARSRAEANLGLNPGLKGGRYSVGSVTEEELAYERLREKDKTLWEKAKQRLKDGFSPGGLMPEPAFEAKIDLDSLQNLAELDISILIKGFERAVKKTYGKRYNQLPPNIRETMNRYLAGDTSINFPDKIKDAMMQMRQYIDSLSKEYSSILGDEISELLADGKNPAAKAKADLLSIIARNTKKYVHRSYKVFDDPEWFSKVSTQVLSDARSYLIQEYRAQNIPNPDRKADQTIFSILKDGTAYKSGSMEGYISQSLLGAKDLSVLKKKRDIAPEIRALMGEYDDIRLNFSKTGTKMSRLIFNQRFLDRILEVGKGNFLFDKDDPNAPKGGLVELAGEKSDILAPLGGMMVLPEIKQAFQNALGEASHPSWVTKIIAVNGAIKYGKTILSPMTQMRNFYSAYFFTVSNGAFDLRHMAKARKVMSGYIRNKPGGAREYYRNLVKHGVLYNNPNAGALIDLLKDSRQSKIIDQVFFSENGAMPGDTQQSYLERAVNNGREGVKWLNDGMQKMYMAGDDFWKIVGFENELLHIIEAKGGITENSTEAEIDAAREQFTPMVAKRIRDTYPTYSMVGRYMKALRKFPLAGTFVSFPSEIIRTRINSAKLAWSDLQDPDLRSLGIKRMAGMAISSAWAYGLAAITKSMMGIDDEEEETLRKLGSPWAENSSFMFWGRDEKGNIRMQDLSFMDPYNILHRPFTAMMRDQPWEKSLASALVDLSSPFLGIDIAAGAVYEIIQNEKISGGRVFNPDEYPMEQTAAIASHLLAKVSPGFATQSYRMFKALKGVKSPSGRVYDVEDEMWALLGLRISTFDPKVSLYYRTFDFSDKIGNARNILTRAAGDPNDVSADMLAETFDRANKVRIAAYKDMKGFVHAAQKSNTTDGEIREILKASGVSARYANNLVRGREAPKWLIRNTFMKGNERRAKVLLDRETAREISMRRRFIKRYASEVQ